MSSIFISYSSRDVEVGTRLRDLLDARGYGTVFRDKDEEHGIPGGTKWAAELFANLERADIVIFLASAASLKSPWCHTELAVAAARGKHLVQISLRKTPIHPLLADRQALPPNADLDELVDALVAALARVGYAPGDEFTWDPDRSPFPGLHRLDKDHAAVLFGRDAEIGACLQRLNGPRPLPLVVSGPSGSGKSSLVRAGVLPRLERQQGTRILPIVEPGDSPLQRVAFAFTVEGQEPDIDRLIADPKGFAFAVDRLVAAGASRVVLFLDQAEDLVARADRAQVGDLVARLQAVDSDRLVVIAAVRSASLDAWLQEPNLAWLGQADPVWVRPLDRNALRDVIVGPAHVAGIRFEPEELVERIVDDTAQGNALPLLAALLEELTEGHSRLAPAVITAKRYQEVGPVARVIERRAQAASDDIRTRRRILEAAVLDAYLRLVEIDDEGKVTAAEVAVEEMPQEVREIFEDLDRHRLVTHDQRIVASADGARAVEVVGAVHEAIFRAWPAIATAIKARRTDLEIRTWLRRDARTWRESGGGQAALTGGRLGLAREWSERNAGDVTPDMRAYLRAALSQVWRRRALTIAVPVLAVITLVVGGLAFQAFSEAQRANAARAETDALRIAGEARAAFPTRPDLGLLLALEAAARSDDLLLRGMPLVGLTQGPGPRRFDDIGQPVEKAALDRVGTHAVVRARDGILFWDVVARQAIATTPASGDLVAMSGDGSTVALSGPESVAIHAWAYAQPRASCAVAGGAITTLALSDSGGHVVVVADGIDDPSQSRVTVLRTSDCGETLLAEVNGHVGAVDIDEVGDRIALVSDVDGAGVWELSTGLPYPDLSDPGDEAVRSVALGSDDRVAAGTESGELLLWDLTEPSRDAQRFRVHGTEQVVALAFSATDETVVSGAADGEIRPIRPTAEPPLGPSLRALPPLDYAGGSVEALDIAAAGTRAVTIDPSGRVVVWDLEGRPPLGPRLAEGQLIDRVAPMPDGSIVAANREAVFLLDGQDGRIRSQAPIAGLTALGSGPTGWAAGTVGGDVLVPSDTPGDLRSIASVPGQRVVALAALPDGGWAAAFQDVSDTGTVMIVRATGEQGEVTLAARPSAMDADSRWLFVGDMNGAVHVFDATDPARPARRVETHAFDIGSIALSPDGSTLATGSDDRTIALWDVADDGTLTERIRLRGHEERVTSLTFSPDGHWLASAGEEPAVLLWNLDVGERVGDPIPVPFDTVVEFARDADRQLLVANDRLDRWDMRFEQWPAIACQIVGSRRLGAAEQRDLLRDERPLATCP